MIPSPADFRAQAGIPQPSGPPGNTYSTVVPVGAGAAQGMDPATFAKRRQYLAAILCAGVGATIGAVVVWQATKAKRKA